MDKDTISEMVENQHQTEKEGRYHLADCKLCKEVFCTACASFDFKNCESCGDAICPKCVEKMEVIDGEYYCPECATEMKD